MALGAPKRPSSGGGLPDDIAEINVTPLVDVMLVLLIVFMVAAGVQTLEASQAAEATDDVLAEAEALLEEARQERRDAEEARNPPTEHREVRVALPRVDSERVNLTDVKRLKLELGADLVFRLGELVVVDCPRLAPGIDALPGRAAGAADAETAAFDVAFVPCLKALGDKLVDNAKLQEDRELYLLADRALGYGVVLKVMAAIRQAGVTDFGLVAEPGLLDGAEVAPTPDPLP